MENSLEVSNKWEPLNKTSYNGLAALIYIMPMIVETLKETAKKKEKRIECIGNFAIATITVYPFYKTFQVVVLYRREE